MSYDNRCLLYIGNGLKLLPKLVVHGDTTTPFHNHKQKNTVTCLVSISQNIKGPFGADDRIQIGYDIELDNDRK